MFTIIPQHLVLYDGKCGLCDGLVRFLLERDRRARFAFAALQSAAARRRLLPFAVSPDQLDTFYVIADYETPQASVLDRSTAALMLCDALGWPYRALSALRYLPRRWRDAAYSLIARNRYRIFGKARQCVIPTAEQRSRFLDWSQP